MMIDSFLLNFFYYATIILAIISLIVTLATPLLPNTLLHSKKVFVNGFILLTYLLVLEVPLLLFSVVFHILYFNSYGLK